MKKVFSLIGIIVGTQFIVSTPAIADTEVSGVISTNTVWNPTGSPYIVTGNVLVEIGVTLDIEPSVEVRIDSAKYITINGTLNAIGTETDSIIISARDTTKRWGRLYFNTLSQCNIKYCRIEYARNSAIYNKSGTLYVEHNTIFNNIGYFGYDKNGAGGIYNSSDIVIKNNTFTNNYAKGGMNGSVGGGVCNDGTALIEDNLFHNNHVFIDHCLGGGAICNDGSAFCKDKGVITINKNTITNNYTEGSAVCSGGGIYIYMGSGIINNNIIKDNYNLFGMSNLSVAGGIVDYHSTISIINNIIKYNTSTSGSPNNILIDYSLIKPVKYNTIIDTSNGYSIYISYGSNLYIRTNNIFATGYAIYNVGTDDIDARYNYWYTTTPATIDAKIWDFYDDSNKGKVFYQPFLDAPFSDTIAPPPLIDLSAVNTTGLVFEVSWTNPSDPSGISEYYYKLGSPPGSDFDITGTFHYPPDTIRATHLGESLYVWLVDSSGNLLYTDYSSIALGEVGVEENEKLLNVFVSVTPNPSPRNTLIKYGLPEKANMTLRLYDISGRLVKTIYSGTQEKGYYEVDIKQDELIGGIYFIRFETDKFKATRKLTIIR